jgi:hypothetical protein
LINLRNDSINIYPILSFFVDNQCDKLVDNQAIMDVGR